MDGTIITKRGMQLLIKLIASKGVLNFSRIAVGTGIIPSGYDPASMVDLVQYKMDGMISDLEADDDTAKITMQISSMGIETGFTITEMGVFAEDPDIGEILYAYLDMKEDPQYIYAEGGEAQKFMEVTLEVTIDAATKVTTLINPKSMITREQFDEGMGTKIDQDGGDIADTVVTTFEETTDPFSVPKPGDTVKAILGKVVKFMQDVRSGCCKVADIVNNCTSTDTDKPLAANQGKVLWDKITAAVTTHKSSGDHDGRYYTESEVNNLLNAKLSISNIVNNLTSTATNMALSAAQGKALNDRVNQLNSDLAVLCTWKQYTINVGVLNAGTSKYDQTSDISLPDGYTSAAITGFALDGANYTACSISKLVVRGNRVAWSIQNLGIVNTGNLTLSLDVLCIKSKFW